MKGKNHVFIACRGDGMDIAANIRESLQRRGYRVVLDRVESDGGEPSVGIPSEIDECADFIPVLTPGSWLKKGNDDRFIREIEYALARKNVVPIITRGVSYPAEPELPGEIRALATRNALPDQAVPQCFEGIMERLDRIFLVSRRRPDARVRFFLAASAVVAALSLGIVAFQEIRERVTYPYTRNDRNLVDSACTYLGLEAFSVIPDTHARLDGLYDAVNYCVTVNPRDFDASAEVRETIADLSASLDKSLSRFDAFAQMLPQGIDDSRLLRGVKGASFAGFLSFYRDSLVSYRRRLDLAAYYFAKAGNGSYGFSWSEKYGLLKDELRIRENYTAHQVCLLLSNVDADYPQLRTFQRDVYTRNFSRAYWSGDAAALEMACAQDRHSLEEVRSKLDIAVPR